jgi:hypothetical protein
VLRLDWGRVPTRVLVVLVSPKTWAQGHSTCRRAETCGVVAQPPSFDDPIRAYRRVREEREEEERCSVFLESETSRFGLKPKLGYKLPAEA